MCTCHGFNESWFQQNHPHDEKLAHCGGPNNGGGTRIHVYFRLSHAWHAESRRGGMGNPMSPVRDLWAGLEPVRPYDAAR